MIMIMIRATLAHHCFPDVGIERGEDVLRNSKTPALYTMAFSVSQCYAERERVSCHTHEMRSM